MVLNFIDAQNKIRKLFFGPNYLFIECLIFEDGESAQRSMDTDFLYV